MHVGLHSTQTLTLATASRGSYARRGNSGAKISVLGRHSETWGAGGVGAANSDSSVGASTREVRIRSSNSAEMRRRGGQAARRPGGERSTGSPEVLRTDAPQRNHAGACPCHAHAPHVVAHPSFSIFHHLSYLTTAATPPTMSVVTVQTKPFEGQKPGTSGLRKRSFAAALHRELCPGDPLRHHPPAPPTPRSSSAATAATSPSPPSRPSSASRRATACRSSSSAKEGILSTPAASHVIRSYKADRRHPAHRLAQPRRTGQTTLASSTTWTTAVPAPEGVTNKIFDITKTIAEYKIVEGPEVDLSQIGSTKFGSLDIQIIDSVKDYIAYLGEIFDFALIKNFLQTSGFTVRFDALHGVTGPYGRAPVRRAVWPGRELDPELRALGGLWRRTPGPELDLRQVARRRGREGEHLLRRRFRRRWRPKHDHRQGRLRQPFGLGGHHCRVGAAGDPPTSSRASRVLRVRCPLAAPSTASRPRTATSASRCRRAGSSLATSWTPVVSASVARRVSAQVRTTSAKQDGLWAVVAWLSILARREQGDSRERRCRMFCCSSTASMDATSSDRYDYEEVDSRVPTSSWPTCARSSKTPAFVGKKLGEFEVAEADDFSYTDPIDGSVSKNQGLYVKVRRWQQDHLPPQWNGPQPVPLLGCMSKSTPTTPPSSRPMPNRVLRPLIQQALAISKLQQFTGRDKPTVIT
ncbi:hypothetical protein L1887_54517 [Cichorium endivia]|nr:hypothetical protein L1887_54517 [Cichorium endivia]